ncbi:hypothetical protein SUDANB66_00826 [Streptomyces sp. SudanB66_2053]
MRRRRPARRPKGNSDALRALIAGELRSGEAYSAPGLATRFGVSATPVREALLDLAKEGLVDVVPTKGYRVTAVSERQLDEYTHVRALIEIPTAAALAGTADPVALAGLRPVAEETVAAATAGDLVAYIDATSASIPGCRRSPGTPTSSRWPGTCAAAPACTD